MAVAFNLVTWIAVENAERKSNLKREMASDTQNEICKNDWKINIFIALNHMYLGTY